jgi:hypothetical protein
MNTTYKTILIGNDKGGVGKDLIAEGFKIALMRAGRDHQLIEIESQKRLGHLYRDTHFIEAPAIGAAIYRNPDAVFEPMDTLASLVQRSPISVVCLGANLTGGFLAWSETNGSRVFGDGQDLHFVCVLTMSRAAIAAGLTNLFDFGIQYPKARRTAILNEFVALFSVGDRHVENRLREAQGEAGPIGTLKLTEMAAPAWGRMQNLGSLADVAQASAQKLIDLGATEGEAFRSMSIFENWLENDLVAPLASLLPDPQETT